MALPLPGTAYIRNFINLQPVQPAAIGKHKDIAVSIRDEDIGDWVLVLGLHPNPAFAATALIAIDGQRGPLEIPAVRNRDHSIFFRNQIFQSDFGFFVDDFGSARITVFLLNVAQVPCTMTCAKLCIAGENFFQFRNSRAKFGQFVFDFLPFQTGEPLQLHFENGLGLDLAKFEVGNQALARFRGRFCSADQFDDRIDVIERFLQTLEDVRTRFRLAQLVLGATSNHVNAMFNEQAQQFDQRQDFRLTIDDRTG